MKKIKLLSSLLILSILISFAKPKSIFGTYVGTVLCADCPGIDQNLKLKSDSTFILKSVYQGRGNGKAFIDKGTFKVVNGQLILLDSEGTSTKYTINDKFIEQLDLDGNKIESDFNFKLIKK